MIHPIHVGAKAVRASLTASALSFRAIASAIVLDTCVSLFNALIFFTPSLSASVSIRLLSSALIFCNPLAFNQAVGSQVFVNRLYWSSSILLILFSSVRVYESLFSKFSISSACVSSHAILLTSS